MRPSNVDYASLRGAFQVRQCGPGHSHHADGFVLEIPLSATKALASELGPLGITVNAINPGSTNSARWDELVRITSRDMGLSAEKAVEHLVREVPLGRVVKMEEVADLAIFLASARAAMISGCAINVDGGRSRSV